MPLFLVTSVCDEGVYPNSFKVVEADSREDIAAEMLAHPYKWERFLRNTSLWWELTYYEYKYGEPRGWSPADMLREIDKTLVDGDSRDQLRIHPVGEITRIPAGIATPSGGDAHLVVSAKPG